MDIGLGDLESITLDSRYTRLRPPGAAVRHAGAGARAAGAGAAGPRGRAAHRRAWSPAIAARRSAGVDQELWRREKLLNEARHPLPARPERGSGGHHAAGAAQQIDTFPGKRVDGVFGMWYGKGPGVDRSGDAFRCANTIGTAKHGGVLAVSGDDHARAFLGLPAPDRRHLRERQYPGPAARRRAATSSISASPGYRAVALLRPLGRAEDHRRDGRAARPGDRARRRSASRRPISSCRRMGSTSTRTCLAGAAAGARAPRARGAAAGGAGLGARQPARPH